MSELAIYFVFLIIFIFYCDIKRNIIELTDDISFILLELSLIIVKIIKKIFKKEKKDVKANG